jgi:hypothetical protein
MIFRNRDLGYNDTKGGIMSNMKSTSPEEHYAWIDGFLNALELDLKAAGQKLVVGRNSLEYLYTTAGYHFWGHGYEDGKKKESPPELDTDPVVALLDRLDLAKNQMVTVERKTEDNVTGPKKSFRVTKAGNRRFLVPVVPSPSLSKAEKAARKAESKT